MKKGKNDQFDEVICKKALATVIIELYTSMLDFGYFFTFKNELKCYEKEFKNPVEQPILDLAFFADIRDPVVQHSLSVAMALIDFSLAYNLRHGIDAEEQIMCSTIDFGEVDRYLPTRPRGICSQSYARLFFYYERYLEETINCLYYYCCALSVKSYKLTLDMKKHINQISEESYRIINMEDTDVELLTNLITILTLKDRLLKNALKKGVRKPRF